MSHGLWNAMHRNLSGKIRRSQQQAEQYNFFKAVNTLYDMHCKSLDHYRHQDSVYKSE
jgi:hypothetical protein